MLLKGLGAWWAHRIADSLTDKQGRHEDRQMTHIWPLCYWSSVVYSADVIDSHRAQRAGQSSTERSDAPPSPQNDQPVSASTLSDSRAVIILIPVRLGGEKTNPDYFNFAKVSDTCRSEVVFYFSQIMSYFGVWSQGFTCTITLVSKSNYHIVNTKWSLWGMASLKYLFYCHWNIVCGKQNENI